MANLSSKTGTVTTPVQAQISLANNSATAVQDMSAYDSQEVTGFVYVDATADLRCSFKVQVVKNGAGTYEIAAVDLAGDDYLGAPLVSFSMSGSVLRITLPNVTGFTSAYLRYQLSAPYLGGNYPLSVDGSQVVSGTVGASFLPTAGAAAAGILSTGVQTIAGNKTFSGTVNAASFQKNGTTILPLVTSTIAITGLSTSWQEKIFTLPNGITYGQVVSIIPDAGINDIVYIAQVALGEWSGVQTAYQGRVYIRLGNAVASTTGNIRVIYYLT